MEININGKPEAIAVKTVLELLQAKEIEPQMVSVELNSTIIDRDAYATTSLNEGDKLELLFFMGGGGKFPAKGIFPYLPFTIPVRGRGFLVNRKWKIVNWETNTFQDLNRRGRREPL